jgi:hypothetical protein
MIELVILYDAGCPHLELARAAVSEAMRVAALDVQVRELERGDAPVELAGFGSPTVLVGGRDVLVGTACNGTACRVYADADGRLSGAPPIDPIVAALRRSVTP